MGTPSSSDEVVGTVPQRFVRVINCSVCGRPASKVSLVGPSATGAWRVIYSGIVAGSGPQGTEVSAEEAAVLTSAFTPPLTYTRIRSAGLYDNAGFCETCDAAFCYEHWHVSDTGGGWCPQRHFKSLDPHWSPAD